jgi:hypothetical protein
MMILLILIRHYAIVDIIRYIIAIIDDDTLLPYYFRHIDITLSFVDWLRQD